MKPVTGHHPSKLPPPPPSFLCFQHQTRKKGHLETELSASLNDAVRFSWFPIFPPSDFPGVKVYKPLSYMRCSSKYSIYTATPCFNSGQSTSPITFLLAVSRNRGEGGTVGRISLACLKYVPHCFRINANWIVLLVDILICRQPCHTVECWFYFT